MRFVVFAFAAGLVAAAGCGDSGPGSCRSAAECASGICRDGRCVIVEDDAGTTIDAFSPPDALPPFDSGCTPGRCPAGMACMDGACIADCRLPTATPCAPPLLCGPTSGTCVMPGEECTPTGDFVPCGGGEFVPTCGPGTSCDVDHCVTAAGCTSIACDASGVCRGVGCGGTGGSVTGVALDPLADVPAATPDAIAAAAHVSGADLCGLTATFEVRVETALYTSAANEGTIWEIDLATGARTAYATGISRVFGFATDPSGTLWVIDGSTCGVGRIEGVAGARTFVPFATGPAGCSRLAAGTDGALYVSGGLEVRRIDIFTASTSTYGTIPGGVAAWGSTFLTGLAFDAAGDLYAGEHWRGIFRIPSGGGVGTRFADAPALALTSGDNPWNEGLAWGPDGRLYVGVFPSNYLTGFIWRAEADGTGATVVHDLASIRAAIPATNYTGIHGVTFGLDGTLYFTNQNTAGNTREALGQLIALRTDGTLELLASGINFDWPLGYDGDVIVGTRVVESVIVPIETDGTARAMLDSPGAAQPFQVRVLVTDPATGRVYVASRTARAL
jgi:hypothetical protein